MSSAVRGRCSCLNRRHFKMRSSDLHVFAVQDVTQTHTHSSLSEIVEGCTRIENLLSFHLNQGSVCTHKSHPCAAHAVSTSLTNLPQKVLLAPLYEPARQGLAPCSCPCWLRVHCSSLEGTSSPANTPRYLQD